MPGRADRPAELTDAMIAAARDRYRQLSEADQRARNEYYGRQPATIAATVFPSWDEVASHFPPSGPPGLAYRGVPHVLGTPVNTLLHHDEGGRLDGVCNYYPLGLPGELPPGAMNVLVRPDRQGRGLGVLLMVAAKAYGWMGEPSPGANPLSTGGRATMVRARRYYAAGTPGYIDPDA